MVSNVPILSITGSDSTGGSGIQADIRTISALGGCAVTAVTSVTVQSSNGIHSIHEMPTELVVGQVKATVNDVHPKAVKVGMIHNAETIRLVRDEIIACCRIVCDPGIVSSKGERLLDEESLSALCRYIIPETRLLILKCCEAELILNKKIATDDDMLSAAENLCDMGAQWVMLRGGQYTEGQLTALLYGGVNRDAMIGEDASEVYSRFFSSVNVEGWQRHGIGGALSSAIATCLAFGDDVPMAISKAHEYLHSQVVYAMNRDGRNMRSADLYNQFMSLVVENYTVAHDVTYYADRLSITKRYLSNITAKVVGKTPKQVIADYLMQEAKILLDTSRLNVQEVSQRLGFSSQALFCNFFRAQSGMSPGKFRDFAG